MNSSSTLGTLPRGIFKQWPNLRKHAPAEISPHHRNGRCPRPSSLCFTQKGSQLSTSIFSYFFSILRVSWTAATKLCLCGIWLRATIHPSPTERLFYQFPAQVKWWLSHSRTVWLLPCAPVEPNPRSNTTPKCVPLLQKRKLLPYISIDR